MNPPCEVRVGADIVRVGDVARSIETFGDRYLTRLFTEHELQSCAGAPLVMASGLAARFAAKEATIKVLRPPVNSPPWRTIEVRRHESGWCEISLTGDAARLAADGSITSMAVSMTHEGDVAAAVVVAIGAPEGSA
jgi:holo-[acyl-carrier protein] synthase